MPEQLVPLRLCTVLTTEGEAIHPFVRCPRRAATIDALACTGCARMRSIEWDPQRGGEVTCTVDEEKCPRPIDRRADFGEAAARVLLHEVITPVTTCVGPDLPLAQLKRILAQRGVRSVAVVDAAGKLEGLISRTDLTTAPDFGCVADIMPRRVHSLPEDAPVAYAIALMAYEDVSEVPVVTADGTLIGLFHVLDALRWVAGRMGYVPPEREDDPSTKRPAPSKPPRPTTAPPKEDQP
jgi:CBS domain-containing protein